jgi:uncharacterized protein YqgC (DUF456 family)
LLQDFHASAVPIPSQPPVDFFRGMLIFYKQFWVILCYNVCTVAPVVPGVGELMLASFPTYSEQIANKSWYIYYEIILSFLRLIYINNRWASEKYDGVRACWNGSGLYPQFFFVSSFWCEVI